MGAGEERRKLLCQCGKPLTTQGLELFCRFSKDTTIVPYSRFLRYGIAERTSRFWSITFESKRTCSPVPVWT